MVLSCFGFRASPKDSKNPIIPENALRVLFAGWASFVIQDTNNQPRLCGEYSPEEADLVQALSAKYADSLRYLNARLPLKLFGWESLQGFLTPRGDVVGLDRDPTSTVSQSVVHVFYLNALDVAACGHSMDHLVVVIDAMTRQLHQWTATNTTPRSVIPCSESVPSSAATLAHALLLKSVKFERLWAGEGHVLALATDGTLYSWGSGRHGQLGHGDLVSEPLPKPIEYLQGIRIVNAACGAAFSVALSEVGDIYTFGLNDHGQLGIGGFSSVSKLGTEEPRRNTAYPQLVDFYDESGKAIDVNVYGVACGRAHIVVLD
ncbi:hypothetical protein BGZ65_002103, partial [Modicella reniformis]